MNIPKQLFQNKGIVIYAAGLFGEISWVKSSHRISTRLGLSCKFERLPMEMLLWFSNWSHKFTTASCLVSKTSVCAVLHTTFFVFVSTTLFLCCLLFFHVMFLLILISWHVCAFSGRVGVNFFTNRVSWVHYCAQKPMAKDRNLVK